MQFQKSSRRALLEDKQGLRTCSQGLRFPFIRHNYQGCLYEDT